MESFTYTYTEQYDSPVKRTIKSSPNLNRTPLEWSMAKRRLCESPLLWFKLVFARLLSPASLSRIDCSPPPPPTLVFAFVFGVCRSGDRSPFKYAVGDELVIVLPHTTYLVEYTDENWGGLQGTNRWQAVSGRGWSSWLYVSCVNCEMDFARWTTLACNRWVCEGYRNAGGRVVHDTILGIYRLIRKDIPDR